MQRLLEQIGIMPSLPQIIVVYFKQALRRQSEIDGAE